MSYPQQQDYSTQTWGEPPLWAPFYGAGPVQAVKRFFRKYATFSGRASRSEYWWWVLAQYVITFVFLVLYLVLGFVGATTAEDGTTVPGPGLFVGVALLFLWLLGSIVPGIALVVRRLHDINLSGWIALVLLVPGVGGILILIFSLLAPNPEGQRFDRPTGA
ncbi:DUF805 domain-containing protein [Sinomonas sp. P47F7]|uniref:DUF805 domain-containing protein n=1 Tax=Sinomonas sp. P47F7 TaxID=3410987 RepID=UPI003BF4FA9A